MRLLAHLHDFDGGPSASGRIHRGLLAGWAGVLLASTSLAAQSLERRLQHRLDTAPLDRNLWGIAVMDDKGKMLYERNGDRLFTPASNTKLVATSAATVLLPPDWKVRTSVYGTGPMANGILSGHLVLYGRGDPTMTAHCFAADTTVAGACEHDPLRALRDLAEKLRQAGLREVEGDLIGDGSYFEPELVHGSWENDDLLWGYSAPVSGLVLNENAITLKIRPAGTVGQPAEIVADSLFPDLTFENRTQTVSDTGAAELELTRSADPWRMVVTGTVRLGARPRTESVAVPDPNQLAANAFRRLLAQAGIRIKGSTRTTTDSLETLNARSSPPLAEVESRPLSDWIFRLLSVSQNLYAELLAKQLGRQFGKAGSWKEGITVERRFLIDSVRVDSTQFSLYDGSGLSARDLVSPRTFVQLLRYMRQHPRYPVFAAGLPQGGISGTLRNRFQGSPLERRVRAKTGSIAAVNTLSGYLEAAGDSTDFTKPPVRIFSIQANHHTLSGRAMIQAIDSVVMDLWRSAKH